MATPADAHLAPCLDRFDEGAVLAGHLGTFPSRKLLALMLAHGGRLAKYGA
jgi:hypothetical protein